MLLTHIEKPMRAAPGLIMAAILIGLWVRRAPQPARAAPAAPTFTVNSPIDAPDAKPGDGACDAGGGICTLRAAIMEANHTPGGGATIRFGLAGVVTYTLQLAPVGEDDESTGNLNITTTTSLIGRGAANTIIDGNQLDGVFSVGSLFNPGAGLTATISGVTIENGRPGVFNPSGGLNNHQTLVLSDSVVHGNAGSVGGGLYNGNRLTLSNSTLSGNSAIGSGGGLFNDSGSTATINNSTLSGNTGGSDGGGGITSYGALTVSGSTISANTAISNGVGGGLANGGPLTITNSTISGNGAAGAGGGLINFFTRTVTLSNLTLSSNMAGGNGGGLANVFASSLALANVTLTGNTAGGNGGGIASSGTLTVSHSTVAGNHAGHDGGGISSDLSSALTLSSSTLSGNTAGGNGGGLANNNAATVSRSTLGGNTADGDGGGVWNKLALTVVNSTVSGNNSNLDGGGLYNAPFATTSLFNATVTGNTANADASGIGVGGGAVNAGFAFSFQNSLLAGNDNVVVISGSPLLNPEDCSGTLTSGGNNIVLSTADCVINGGFVMADPLVDPLANNGGPTQTHALRAGSPAIDTGSALGCKDLVGALLTTDQRGFARPVGGRCDIGAFEHDPPGPFLPVIQR